MLEQSDIPLFLCKWLCLDVGLKKQAEYWLLCLFKHFFQFRNLFRNRFGKR